MGNPSDLQPKVQDSRVGGSAEFHVGIQGKHSSSVVFSGTEILEGENITMWKRKSTWCLYFPQCLRKAFIDRLKSGKKDPWDVLRPVG